MVVRRPKFREVQMTNNTPKQKNTPQNLTVKSQENSPYVLDDKKADDATVFVSNGKFTPPKKKAPNSAKKSKTMSTRLKEAGLNGLEYAIKHPIKTFQNIALAALLCFGVRACHQLRTKSPAEIRQKAKLEEPAVRKDAEEAAGEFTKKILPNNAVGKEVEAGVKEAAGELSGAGFKVGAGIREKLTEFCQKGKKAPPSSTQNQGAPRD